jgi:hypothetical protein
MFDVQSDHCSDYSKFHITPLAASGQSDRKRNFLELENSLKMLWERFATAIKSVGPTSIIVVENHSHPALTSTKNDTGFH